MIALLIPLLLMIMPTLAVWGIGLLVGNGLCRDCGRICSPWSDFCRRHNPYGGAR